MSEREVRGVDYPEINFTCEHCGRDVPWCTFNGEDKPRDRCPFCHWSKHVSIGANYGYPPCDGMMRGVPVGDAEVVMRCLGCGFSYRMFIDDYMMRQFEQAGDTYDLKLTGAILSTDRMSR